LAAVARAASGKAVSVFDTKGCVRFRSIRVLSLPSQNNSCDQTITGRHPLFEVNANWDKNLKEGIDNLVDDLTRLAGQRTVPS
jgi:cytochrome c5